MGVWRDVRKERHEMGYREHKVVGNERHNEERWIEEGERDGGEGGKKEHFNLTV